MHPKVYLERYIVTDAIVARGRFVKTLALLGVLLIALTGFAQAVHVHSDNSKLPSHECSICSIAHCGVIGTSIYQPIPVMESAIASLTPDVILRSTAVVLSLRIRPPPSL